MEDVMRSAKFTYKATLSVLLIILLCTYAGGCGQKKKETASSQDQPVKASAVKSVVSFSREIQPIFQSKCTPCHIASSSGGLKLASHAELMQGGEDGKVVIEGNSANSIIIKLLEGESSPRMPLGRSPLDAADIQKIKAWIDAGAKDN
jgi:hypothetical protein